MRVNQALLRERKQISWGFVRGFFVVVFFWGFGAGGGFWICRSLEILFYIFTTIGFIAQ